MMKAKPLGLYVHIPFCLKKCAYCDFCSFERFSLDDIGEYTEALCREICGYKREPKLEIDTIFFGGGTPSVLPTTEFEKIVSAIRSTFDLTFLSEFTVEVNPKTLNSEKIAAFVASGVNRISIGLQSVHENELKKLGRVHTFEDFLHTFNLVRSSGISNVSIDLMYGIPDQTLQSLRESVDAVLQLKPQHLSLYSLILEEGTPLYERANDLRIPDEDNVADMYDLCCEMLSSAGYSHYEVSNYSLPGFQCHHNVKYWNTDGYIGVGVAAHSYFEGKRYFNGGSRLDEDSLKNYKIASLGGDTFASDEKTDEICEYIMLRLRLKDGIIFSEYRERFGEDFRSGREDKIRLFSANGLAELDDISFRLTERGFFLSNAIIAEIL